MLRVLKNMAQMATTILALSSPTNASGLSTNVSSALTGFPPCDALINAGLSDRLLFATDPEYSPRIASYWALNTRRRPYCLIQPHTANEVSTAITALLHGNNGAGDWHIAVRAGGHNLGSSNNIESGVTIDLKYLNRTTYDPITNIASVSPGSKWQDVYATLHQYGVVVTGGRDGDVGVGGFLLGGGSTYYMAQEGFGCDSIRNFEVVLVNGSIVNANRGTNADLWRALKGGGSNFGIVTRYDMEALEDKLIARGTRTMAANYTTQFVDAVVDFTDTQQRDDDNALIAVMLHVEGEDILSTIEVNTDGVENSTAFDKFSHIPQLSPFSQTVEPLYQAAANSTLPGDSWALQTTLTFKNTPDILIHATKVQQKFSAALQASIGAENFYTILFFQPLPSFLASISAERGGNMFADNLRTDNAILWTAGVFVYTNQSDFAIAQAYMYEMVAELESYAMETGADNQLIYLNYAGFAQDPLGSYPAKDVEFMKGVAARYDPEGRFQERIPGGFKISRVGER
ncbi:hypothetical protein BDW59DRAFT_164999 [Aspergillus cavernicola]|uniref:FAD-binding PCMH-type domain-containing protein n=1 Tax=Aspergillus cavernicola TaxID=176166 RepID=A0ABR4HVL6_9EURO